MSPGLRETKPEAPTGGPSSTGPPHAVLAPSELWEDRCPLLMTPGTNLGRKEFLTWDV